MCKLNTNQIHGVIQLTIQIQKINDKSTKLKLFSYTHYIAIILQDATVRQNCTCRVKIIIKV